LRAPLGGVALLGRLYCALAAKKINEGPFSGNIHLLRLRRVCLDAFFSSKNHSPSGRPGVLVSFTAAFRSRSNILRQPALRASIAAALVASVFAAPAFAAEDADKSPYLALDPLVVNLAPDGQGEALARAVSVILPPAARQGSSMANRGVNSAGLTRGVDANARRWADAVAAETGTMPNPADGVSASAQSPDQAASGAPGAPGGSNDGATLLRAQITLAFPDAASKAAAVARLPEIRGRLLLLLSSQTSSQMASAAQKEALSEAIVELANAPDGQGEAALNASRALITGFVTQ
jgi:hypothetical protein